MQFASESAKPEEAREAEESLECDSQFTSEGSLAPLQTLIVLEPKADDDLCEVSVEVTANTNLLTTPPEVEHQVDPPVGDVVPHVPVFRGEEEDDTPRSLLLLRMISQTSRMQVQFMPRALLIRKSVESSPTPKMSTSTVQVLEDLNYFLRVRNMS